MNSKQPLHRTDLLDTRIEAHGGQIEVPRKMPPEAKVRLSFQSLESLQTIRSAAKAHERSADSHAL